MEPTGWVEREVRVEAEPMRSSAGGREGIQEAKEGLDRMMSISSRLGVKVDMFCQIQHSRPLVLMGLPSKSISASSSSAVEGLSVEVGDRDFAVRW